MMPIDLTTMSRRDFLRMAGLAMAGGATATVLSACDRVLPFGNEPDDDAEETPKEMPSLVVCDSRAFSFFTLDPIQAEFIDTAQALEHSMSGLARWRVIDGVVTVTPELAEELVEPKENENGTFTYTYTIAKGAVWSDGKEITADDFVYAWNRAANSRNGSVFRDFFDCIEGYSDASDMRLAVVAEDPRTLSVTLSHNVPYWNDLIAYVPFLPIREDAVGDDYAWATDVKNFIYSGPYVITSFTHGSYEDKQSETVTFEKRDDYLYADSITVRNLRIVYGKSSDEQLQMLQGGDSSDILVSDEETEKVGILDNPSNTLLAMSKDVSGIKRRAVPLLGTEWLMWDMDTRLVPETTNLVGDEYERAQAEIRHAFALMLDRDAVSGTQFGSEPASTIVPPGMGDAGASDFSANAGPSSDYDGYIDTTSGATERNRQQAIEIFKKYYPYDEASGKFSGVPPIKFIGSSDTFAFNCLNKACYKIGITIESELVAYSTLMDAWTSGTYDLSVSNWFADFTDPITFLGLWSTSSVTNRVHLGQGQHANARIYSVDLSPIGEETTISSVTWQESYDLLLNRIIAEKDSTKRFVLLHQAEDLIMSTWAIMPTVYFGSSYIIDEGLTGMEKTPFNKSFFGHVHPVE